MPAPLAATITPAPEEVGREDRVSPAGSESVGNRLSRLTIILTVWKV
jgi:hypothetical protein